MRTNALKTVTVTSQNAINYGAVLQSYALQKKLLQLGIDDEILDIKKNRRIYFREIKFGRTLLSDIFNNLVNLFYIAQTIKKVRRFRSFVRSDIKTTRCYKTVKELVDNPCVADVYITGGDQMFNAHNGIHPASFLQFGSSNAKRISYSTSMGTPIVAERYLGEFIAALERYDFLSVRERCMKNYISELCSVPCSVNVDPSFFLTKKEWEKVASNNKISSEVLSKKYILVYPLLHNPILNEAIEKLRHDTGFEVIVVNPCSRSYVKGDMVIRDAGPLEFLSLFINSQYVMTTSFHGTCFAIIFQKPFFSFIRDSGETRINNLLSMLDIDDRIITNTSQITLENINYMHVNEKLKAEIEKANAYLMKALGV